MRSTVVLILGYVINWLVQLKKSIEQSISRLQLDFEPLSPISDADIVDGYKQVLDYALINSKKHSIQNIAITGPYGAGKTSTIKTYFHKYRPIGFKELTVSLATFKEELSKEEDEPSQNELLRKIELSILQQILYHVDGNKVPHSKFRGIQPLSFRKKILYSGFSFLFLFSAANLYFPDLLPYFYFKIELINKNQPAIDIIATIIFTTGLGYLLFKAVGFFGKLSIDSFKFQDTEVKFNHSQSESYLNLNIDEILYFFKSTDYNVLIIEDLDRFQQTEIFTKLREINLLINSSAYVDKQVVFIYAIRDEIFKEEIERTKFFDFIIPVIPIVNPSNSITIFKKKASKYNLSFSEDLLDTISLFVGDMRLLHNIMNEFMIYRSKLSQQLVPDKLLAIIVFKNLFPGEYSKSLQNDGILHELVLKKTDLVELEIQNIEDEVLTLKNKLSEVEKHSISDIKDLRRIYLFEIFKNYIYLQTVYVNNRTINFHQILDSDDFETWLIGNPMADLIQSYGGRVNLVGLDKVEKVIGDKGYKDRANLIHFKTEEEKQKILLQIEKKQRSIFLMQKIPLRELISIDYVNKICDRLYGRKSNLIFALFKGGYIDESYHDYVSIFHESEDSIARLDYEYLLNLKSGVESEFDLPIQKVNLLIKKIGANYFETNAILNFRLVEYVIENSIFREERQSLKVLLNSGKQKSTEFLFAFLEKTKSVKTFLNFVFHNWANAWSSVSLHASLSSDIQKKNLFIAIINQCDGSILQILFDDPAFREMVLNDPHFFDLFESNERIIYFLENTKPTFKNLNFNPKYIDVYKEILKNEWFEINPEMVATFLKAYSQYEERDFLLKNYTVIQKSEIAELIELVNDNIEKYVSNLYLGLGDSFEEDEEFLLKLCNREELPQELVKKVIEKSKKKISDISKIETFEIQSIFFEEKKVKADWINIFKFSDDKKENLPIVCESLNGFSENELQEIIETYDKEEDSEQLLNQLIVQKELSITSFKLFAPLVDFVKIQFNFNEFSSEKISCLLTKNLVPLNNHNYTQLKEMEKEFHLELAKNNKQEFVSNIDNYELSLSDLEKMLKSTEWDIEEKQALLQKFSSGEIVSNQPVLETLVEILISEVSFTLNDDLLFQVLVSPNITQKETINILEKYTERIGAEQVPAILNSMGDEYPNLLNEGEIVVAYSKDMELLLKTLKSMKYISNFKAKKEKFEVYKQ